MNCLFYLLSALLLVFILEFKRCKLHHSSAVKTVLHRRSQQTTFSDPGSIFAMEKPFRGNVNSSIYHVTVVAFFSHVQVLLILTLLMYFFVLQDLTAAKVIVFLSSRDSVDFHCDLFKECLHSHSSKLLLGLGS